MEVNFPQWYIFVIGIVMPFIVEFLKRSSWTRPRKAAFALFCSVVAGLIATWITGQLNWANLLVTMTAIFTVSQMLYDTWFKSLFNK